MFRSAALLVLLSLVIVSPRTSADDKPDLTATVRQLEKDIAAVRGLEFKEPVVAKIIPRPKDADKKLQGYYSIKDKALFVYDDLSGPYERGVLIHEMVHALQDQHFGLKKLHSTTFDGDADLARAALIEGDATFTMIELLKKDQPKVGAMLDVPLEKAKDIPKAFLYAQGARYVKALKERGGWEAVNSAYKFPPDTTARILHPEGVATIDLGFGTSRGELAILQMFAANSETAEVAAKAAAGWKGDRFVEQGSVKSWIVAFTTRDGAQGFHAALVKLRMAEQPQLKKFLDEPGASAWHDGAAVRAVHLRGDRVLVLDAPDDAAYRTLLDKLDGPPELAIYSAKEKRNITFGELTDRLLDADLVCIGETHDSDLHHRVQLQVIKALYARDARLGVGLEMFQRPYQKEVDRYLKGESTEDDFLKAAEYRQRWGFDWGLYRPIVEFCRRNELPIAALNAPRELTKRVSAVGFTGLNDEEKKQLGPMDFQVKEHRDYWYERLAAMHGKTKVSDEQKERGYQVMTIWDDYMAASAARFQQERHLRRLVVLAGSGHIDRGFGIPQRTARRTGGKAITLRIEVGGDTDKAFAEAVTDFVLVVKQP